MQPEYLSIRSAFPAVLAVCLLVGCDNGSLVEPAPKLPFEGIKLTIANTDPVSRELLATHGKVWALTRGVQLEIVDRPLAEVPNADLGFIPPAELARYAHAGELASVPETIRHPSHPYHFDYLASIYREKLLLWDGVPVALPVVGEGFVLAYRKDRLTAIQAAPPATWDELEKLAARIGPGALAPLPNDDATLDRDFFSVAATMQRPAMMASDAGARPRNEMEANRLFAFHYDLITGEPRIATPAFVAALRWFQRVQPFRAKDAQQPPVLWFATLRELANDPNAAQIGIAPIPGTAMIHDFDTGKLMRTNVAINRVPYVGWGGTLGVVRRSSAHTEAAWDLLTYLGSADTIGTEIIAAARWGVGPYRTAHIDGLNQKLWASYPLGAPEREQLVTTLRQHVPAGLVNPVIRLRTPDQDQKMQILARELREAITKSSDPTTTLQAVAKSWEERDKSLSAIERVTRYRLSLGLNR